jgi:hypothetical protein
MSTSSERGTRKHSRAHLQKHLRNLQSEMKILEERVRIAEDYYRTTSPFEHSISDTSESSRSATSSSCSGCSASAWKPHLHDGASAPTGSLPCGMGAPPPRRGTWKTSAGNVLVFYPAFASDTELSSPLHSRTADLSEHNMDDESDEGQGLGMGGEKLDGTLQRYQCIQAGCLKSFTTSGHARRHSRTHVSHKLFLCPHEGCDSKFTRRDNCRQHQRARHETTIPVPEVSARETLESLIPGRQ